MKTIQLTHTFSQETDDRNKQTDLSITVKYNPDERTVEEILSVYSFNWKQLVTTDLTDIMVNNFGSMLDSMIDSIDWPEVYRSETEEATA